MYEVVGTEFIFRFESPAILVAIEKKKGKIFFSRSQRIASIDVCFHQREKKLQLYYDLSGRQKIHKTIDCCSTLFLFQYFDVNILFAYK